MEIDVRAEIDEFRFADGGPGENTVYLQHDYGIVVVNGVDKGEAEVRLEDIDNLIEALRRAKEHNGGRYMRAVDTSGNTSGYVSIKVNARDFDWIKHDGANACPTRPLDILEYDQGVHLKNEYNIPADQIIWRVIEYYRHKKDEDGIPYCSNEGLESWTEYVASDDDGEAWQFENCPIAEEHGEWWANCKFTRAPHHDNTSQHWTQTLRRVWRKE